MAKATFNVSGWTIKDISDPTKIDINTLSRADLSRVVGRLVSASNKRLRNLEKTKLGQLSPAYRSRVGVNRYQRTGRTYGYFSAKGKNVNQLRQLYAETRGFLNLRTSTVKGWEEQRNIITSGLGIDLSTKRKAMKFWRTYRKLEEIYHFYNKGIKSRLNSEEIQELLAQQFTQKGGFNQKADDIIQNMEQKITNIYEQEQASYSGMNRAGSDIAYDEDDYDDEDMDF